MNRSATVRLGIPVRKLTLGILIPFGVLLVMSAILLSVFVVNRLQDRALHEQQVTVRTLFDTEASLHPSLNGLTVLARNRGYERIWILSATGDILASSKESDIGSRLDERWWRRLEGRRSGFNQESVQFGDGTIMLTALHHAEMGRWVVLLSRPRSCIGRYVSLFGTDSRCESHPVVASCGANLGDA